MSKEKKYSSEVETANITTARMPIIFIIPYGAEKICILESTNQKMRIFIQQAGGPLTPWQVTPIK